MLSLDFQRCWCDEVGDMNPSSWRTTMVWVSVSKIQGVLRSLVLKCTKKDHLRCAQKFRNGIEINTLFTGRLFATKKICVAGEG